MTTPRESAELYNRCRSGQPREREAALAELRQHLLRVAGARLKTDPSLRHLADDATQEALTIIWRKLEAGHGPRQPGSFLSWAATVVTNELGQQLRRRRPAVGPRGPKRVPSDRLVDLDSVSEGGRPLASTIADASAEDVDSRLSRWDTAERLAADIARSDAISEASRTVLLKGYLEDWDDEELAHHLGTTKSNVQVIRTRDLQRLRSDHSLVARLRALLGLDRDIDPTDESASVVSASSLREVRKERGT